jgi:hypothetical protein
MDINLSDEMIATLHRACVTALEDYEARLPFVRSACKNPGGVGKLAEIRRDRAVRNRIILEERIANTQEAVAMLREMMTS